MALGRGPWLRAAVLCHTGCERAGNEDNFCLAGHFRDCFDPAERDVFLKTVSRRKTEVFTVCDGMGGEAYGERASYIAAQTVCQGLPLLRGMTPLSWIERQVGEMQARVTADRAKNGALREGTTASFLILSGETAHIAGIGDSRIYLLRDSVLSQVTCDDTMAEAPDAAQLLKERGLSEQAAGSILTRYIGMQAPDIMGSFSYYAMPVFLGDRWLLCTDGLSDLLQEEAIARCLASASPEAAVRGCAELAMEYGGKDNITCMVVDVRRGRAPVRETDLADAITQT